MWYSEDSTLAICVPRAGGLMGVSNDKVTDLDIQALVDEELSEDRVIAVAGRVKESPLFQKRYAELNHQNELLKLWWSSSKRTT